MALFEREGVSTGIDLERLADAAAWVEQDVPERPLPGRMFRVILGQCERAAPEPLES